MDNPGNAASHGASAEPLHWMRFLLGFPLAALGGLVSVVFAIIVFGYIASRLTGGRPLSLSGFFSLWLIFGAFPLSIGRLLLRKDQVSCRKKKCLHLLLLSGLVVLITAGVDSSFGPRNWHTVFTKQKALVADATGLQATYITPHLETEILAGTNVLWCGTMQLAWNEACDLVGGELHFEQESPMVAALNKRSFTKDSLDQDSYVAMAGFVRTNIHQVIRDSIKKTFGSTFRPAFIPDRAATPRPQDFIAYACLYKHLEFPSAFERLDDALRFNRVPVRAFGLESYKPAYTNIYPHVLILDYRNENDFVVELETKSGTDRLVLAKVQPETTLAETVARVRERSSRTNAEPSSSDDTLLIPRMDFDLTRRFAEFEGRHLLTTNVTVAGDLFLLSAVQNTRFEMNEKGVELRSEAHMAFGCSAQKIPTPKHRMIFDKPFLVLLERTNATVPYFALWVDNAELLICR